MQQALSPHRLNCPWRATANAAMVRSAMAVITAPIGAVGFGVLIAVRQPSTSRAILPARAMTVELTATLFVASRIDTLISVAI